MNKFAIRHSAAARKLAVMMGLLAVTSLGGCGIDPASRATSQSAEPQDLGIITNVMNRVEQDYVAPVTGHKLVDNALKGMLTGLDPHSDYMDAAEYARMESDTEGKFGGVGMTVIEKDDTPQVLGAIDGTPAAEAGIDPGDRIIKIDGLPTEGMSLSDVVARLRGVVGTKVTLAIQRNDRPPFDLSLTRSTIHVHSVKSMLEADKVGYARISTFVDTTQGEMTSAIAELKRKAGGHLNGFILDLRNDPGGELKASIDIAGDFLDGGTIVMTRGRDKQDNQAYTAAGAGDLIKGVPMVVLINGASASAAEIVAGALQDYHRAVLLGTQSFGKGSVQSIIPLEGGGALRLTTSLYYTPSGRSIQGVGLAPDYVVSLPKDEEVANAVAFRESDFSGAFQNPGSLSKGGNAQPTHAVPAGEAPSFERPIKPNLIATAQDAQLKAALDHFRDAA